MNYEEAKALQESWGDKPCDHRSFTDKYLFGSKTGDFVCEQCGKFFTQRQKAQRARSKESPKLDKLLEQNALIKDRLAVLTKRKDLLDELGKQDVSSSMLDPFIQEQESLIALADQLIKEIGAG
jgi:uncharacterized Zn finger protein (UPF0148 family)